MILIKCIYFQTAGYDICNSSIPYFIRPGSTIMSPNYPNYYENYENCSVEIRFDANQKIEIEILATDIESGGDFLNVYDGPLWDNSPLAYLTGYDNAGKTFTSTDWPSKGNVIGLHWTSDSSVTEQGFLLIAKAGKDNATF